MTKIAVFTKKKREVVDITDIVEKALSDVDKTNGVCNVFVMHTTAAIACADLDPGTDLDILDVLEKLTADMTFRHSHKPEHAPDHILGTIIGPSVSVPFEDRSLVLGTWQRVILLEFDGPREREVVVSAS